MTRTTWTIFCILIFVFSDGHHLRKSNLRESSEYKGVKLVNNPDFNKEKFVDNIILALEGRFNEFQKSEAVIKATCIADLKSWPHEWDSLKGLRTACFWIWSLLCHWFYFCIFVLLMRFVFFSLFILHRYFVLVIILAFFTSSLRIPHLIGYVYR